MPARNAEKYVDEAIGSVLKQRRTVFELLVVDDASTDGTWDRIQTYKHSPKIRAWRFRKQKGEGAARNYLIARARGRYLAFCDADDVMLAGNLFVLSRILDRHPSVGAAYGDLYVAPLRGGLKIKRRFMPEKSWDLLGGCFAHGGTLIRRSMMRKAGGYRPQFKFFGDCDLFLRLSELTCFYHHAGKPLYRQRQSPGSLSDQPLKKQRETSQILLRDAIQRRYGYRTQW